MKELVPQFCNASTEKVADEDAEKLIDIKFF